MTPIAFRFPLANGLHARPASLLQELCRRFDAKVVFRNMRRRSRADAGSVLELVASGTASGDPCLLEVSGRQAEEAAAALRAFVANELPHADDGAPPPVADAPAGETAWLPPVFQTAGDRCRRGRSLAPGSGRGRALRAKGRRSLPERFAAGKKDPGAERRLFEEACRRVEADLGALAGQNPGNAAAAILKAQLAILADPGFRGEIAALISNRKMAAGAAIAKTASRYAAVLQGSTSAYLRERAADLDDIASQLADALYGPARGSAVPRGRGPFVWVAASLSPAGLLAMDRRRLRGLVLGAVGATSHVAILARSYAIPAVSLPPKALALIGAGTEVIVDGRRGLVIIAPGAALRRYYHLEEESAGKQRQRLARRNRQPAATRDKVRVEIAANIAGPAELGNAWRSGAEGIGLFRSEFLFLEREEPPSEKEQTDAYFQAARSAGDRRIIFRTLDIGGDKPLPYLGLPREENPFLGYRAVRFYGEHADLIRCQLRALLRATAASGHLKIMVPMVTAVAEVRLVRRLLSEAVAELRARKARVPQHIELGIMVETPVAALAIASLAREADFFSVGSNDLLQYTLAVDRGSTRLAGLYDPLHPAFLRLLSQAAGQAKKAKRWLGICGEMAGRSDCLPLLVGLGFDELSMAPPLIPAVKERLGRLDGGECRALLRRALAGGDAAEVAGLLREFNGRGAAMPVVGAEIVRLDSTSRSPVEAIKELCDLLEIAGRVSEASTLEEAVWKREETFATDLGLGFALPHGKSPAVRAASIAFLRPKRPIRWSSTGTPVRAVLLIAIPDQEGEEHLRLIARLSRQLMHEDFRAALLAARDAAAVATLLNGGLKAV